jgi:alanyl-tRNA synthetase
MMIINDGGRPSNVDRGYILRRLLRRMTRHLNKLGIDLSRLPEIIDVSINSLEELYPELNANRAEIKNVIIEEKDKFVKTLQNGEREFEKVAQRAKNSGKTVIDTEAVFNLYETYGFPPEMTEELAKEQGLQVDMSDYQRLFKEHQDKSRLGSEQKFKGGLASTGEIETKYHTATHLLNAALKVVLGDHVHQKGSNITAERMRFDFSHGVKMTDEEKQKTEDLVNEWIEAGFDVNVQEMPKDEAIKSGAECMFIEKYPDVVTVYTIGDVSKELCGGPHVKNTKELGHFKIKKEEASSAGVRRIKAVLE